MLPGQRFKRRKREGFSFKAERDRERKKGEGTMFKGTRKRVYLVQVKCSGVASTRKKEIDLLCWSFCFVKTRRSDEMKLRGAGVLYL